MVWVSQVVMGLYERLRRSEIPRKQILYKERKKHTVNAKHPLGVVTSLKIRRMEETLNKYQYTEMLTYMDDILLYRT